MKTNQLNWRALALSFGMLWGLYLGLATLFAMSNISVVGFSADTFSWLRGLYPMLSATVGGIFVGLGIGLVCGIICGSILGWLYNVFLALPVNLSMNERLGRLVLGLLLVYGGDYASGLVGGIVVLLGSISLAEAVVGYCWLMHKVWK